MVTALFCLLLPPFINRKPLQQIKEQKLVSGRRERSNEETTLFVTGKAGDKENQKVA